MKRPLIALTLALTAGAVPKGQAQDTAGDSPNPNWFSFGPQFGLNLNTKFKYAGTVGSGSPGPATGGDMNRNYNDGYVRKDNSGDAGGLTWNWGYDNASQVQGNTLTLHSTSANVSGTQNDDPQFGFDLAFGRDLGKVAGGTWGLQAAFDFTEVSVHDDSPLSGNAKVISDAYALNGVIPPPPPYSGTANGPGPLISDTPTRSIESEAVVITGQRTLVAQLYALRLGPYYELPLGKGWSGRLSGGVAVAAAESRYTFNETLNLSGDIMVNNAGSASDLEFRAGGFMEAQLLYAFNSRWSGFVGAQYEYLGSFSQTVAGEQAQLNLASSVYVLFGAQVRF